MNNKITILTTTHCIASAHRIQKSYSGDHDRYNSSTNLIENTINTLYKSHPQFSDCRHIISLDHNKSFNLSNEYLDNLRTLENKYKNINLIVTEKGIYDSIKNLINSVDTNYYLWFEHDWEFNKTVNFESIINLFDKYTHINYLKFNKRNNIPVNIDRLIKDSEHIKDFDLCVTDGWSNNPYFGRSLFFKNVLKQLDELKNVNCTIELDVQKLYRDDINKFGINKAEEMWGIYIYGKPGYEQVVNHTNGKKL